MDLTSLGMYKKGEKDARGEMDRMLTTLSLQVSVLQTNQ